MHPFFLTNACNDLGILTNTKTMLFFPLRNIDLSEFLFIFKSSQCAQVLDTFMPVLSSQLQAILPD